MWKYKLAFNYRFSSSNNIFMGMDRWMGTEKVFDLPVISYSLNKSNDARSNLQSVVCDK